MAATSATTILTAMLLWSPCAMGTEAEKFVCTVCDEGKTAAVTAGEAAATAASCSQRYDEAVAATSETCESMIDAFRDGCECVPIAAPDKVAVATGTQAPPLTVTEVTPAPTAIAVTAGTLTPPAIVTEVTLAPTVNVILTLAPTPAPPAIVVTAGTVAPPAIVTEPIVKPGTATVKPGVATNVGTMTGAGTVTVKPIVKPGTATVKPGVATNVGTMTGAGTVTVKPGTAISTNIGGVATTPGACKAEFPDFCMTAQCDGKTCLAAVGEFKGDMGASESSNPDAAPKQSACAVVVAKCPQCEKCAASRLFLEDGKPREAPDARAPTIAALLGASLAAALAAVAVARRRPSPPAQEEASLVGGEGAEMAVVE